MKLPIPAYRSTNAQNQAGNLYTEDQVREVIRYALREAARCALNYWQRNGEAKPNGVVVDDAAIDIANAIWKMRDDI